MFVKPNGPLVVRDPVSKRPLPLEGGEVPENSYWLRRVAVNDVIVVTPIPDSSAGA